jgi:hypothetical protein
MGRRRGGTLNHQSCAVRLEAPVWAMVLAAQKCNGTTSAVELRALAGSCSGDVRYNHFGPTMLPLLAYLPTDLSVLCLR